MNATHNTTLEEMNEDQKKEKLEEIRVAYEKFHTTRAVAQTKLFPAGTPDQKGFRHADA